MKYILADNLMIQDKEENHIPLSEVKVFKPQTKEKNENNPTKSDQRECFVKHVSYLVVPLNDNSFHDYVMTDLDKDILNFLKRIKIGSSYHRTYHYAQLNFKDYRRLVPEYLLNDLDTLNTEYQIQRVLTAIQINNCDSSKLDLLKQEIPNIIKNGFSVFLEVNLPKGSSYSIEKFDQLEATEIDSNISSFLNEMDTIDISLEINPTSFSNDINLLKKEVSDLLGINADIYIEQQGRSQNFVIEPLHPKDAKLIIDVLGSNTDIKIIDMGNNIELSKNEFDENFEDFFNDQLYYIDAEPDQIEKDSDSNSEEDDVINEDDHDFLD